jgi:hypothetical protein
MSENKQTTKSLAEVLASFGLVEEISANDHDRFASDVFEALKSDESLKRVLVIGGNVTDADATMIASAADSDGVLVLHATYAQDADTFRSLHGKVQRSSTSSKTHNRVTYGDAHVGRCKISDDNRGMFYVTR